MKPHKHVEYIKAWADGIPVQFMYQNECRKGWYDIYDHFDWSHTNNCMFRIKPEPKPDVIEYWFAYRNGHISFVTPARHNINLKLSFDSETGELKSAEVLE